MQPVGVRVTIREGDELLLELEREKAVGKRVEMVAHPRTPLGTTQAPFCKTYYFFT
jgi:hypothetical protein